MSMQVNSSFNHLIGDSFTQHRVESSKNLLHKAERYVTMSLIFYFILYFCIWLAKQVVTVNKAELTAEKEIANGV